LWLDRRSREGKGEKRKTWDKTGKQTHSGTGKKMWTKKLNAAKSEVWTSQERERGKMQKGESDVGKGGDLNAFGGKGEDDRRGSRRRWVPGKSWVSTGGLQDSRRGGGNKKSKKKKSGHFGDGDEQSVGRGPKQTSHRRSEIKRARVGGEKKKYVKKNKLGTLGKGKRVPTKQQVLGKIVKGRTRKKKKKG